jgi:enoyl-CoA hydratase/carnithine racemase
MTDTDAPLLLIERDRALLQLTLNRPHSANALNPELTEALIEALAEAQDIRLCVIRGSGRHFCAGFDLSELEQLSDGDLLWRFLRIETLLQAVHHAPFATLALGHGQIVGAGADLFAACGRRVTSAEARLRFPGWNFELALGTRRLTRQVGQDAVRDLLIDSKSISAEQGLACGLVTDLCSADQWPSLQAELLQRACALSPTALARMLELTLHDSRSEDLAAIVQSAGRPGLKQRIMNYRQRVTTAANQPGS